MTVNTADLSATNQPRNPAAHLAAYCFTPGKSGNPLGRPKGSRHKLGEDFLAALQEDFQANGKVAIARVRDKRPHEYLKVIASILPKQLEIKEGAFDGIDDEQLFAIIAFARASLGVVEGVASRVVEAPGDEQAQALPAVQEAG